MNSNLNGAKFTVKFWGCFLENPQWSELKLNQLHTLHSIEQKFMKAKHSQAIIFALENTLYRLNGLKK